MPKFHVSLYREMRVYFPGVEADTAEAAAKIAADKQTRDAELVDDCDGTALAALVDHEGDEEFSHSVTIDLDLPKCAADDLLSALQALLDVRTPDVGPDGSCRHCLHQYEPRDVPLLLGHCPSDTCAGSKARAVIGRATPKTEVPNAPS